MAPEITLTDIREAAVALEKVILRTPTLAAPWLTEQTGASAFLKLENLQIISSFKVRGAFVKLSQLSKEQQRKGVVAVSAGNHAQGVAYHARALGIKATIVMPKTIPYAKIESTQNLGAKVILEGQTLDEAVAYALQLAEQNDLALIYTPMTIQRLLQDKAPSL